MLFSLTITDQDINPGTGNGFVRAFFGYTIPYALATAEPGDNEPDALLEDFNEDDPGGPPAAVVTGTIFNESNLRIQHNIGLLNNVQLVAVPGAADDQNRLQFRTTTSDLFRFSFLDGDVPGSLPRVLYSFQFTVAAGTGSAVGLPTANTTVRLILDGQVVATVAGAQLAAQNITNPGTGVGTFDLTNAEFNVPGFDTVEFAFTGGPNDPFTIDDIGGVSPTGNFAQIVEGRIFGAAVTLTGPVGTTAQFFDLYNRPIIRTIRLGVPQTSGSQVPLVDIDDNGIPNFNDGIGRIVVSGGNRNTTLTLFGGPISNSPQDNATFVEGGFSFTLVDSVLGLYDDFEAAGFGYIRSTGDQVAAAGLPPGPGSVIIGSPYVRPLDNYNPGGAAPGFTGIQTTGFVNPNQGIFVNDGRSIKSVYVHGIVHGSSRFTGALESWYAGYQVGSLTVDGDLGTFISGTDAGMWMNDPNFENDNFQGRAFPTAAQLVVGRTLDQVHVAGRSLLDITVVGDLSRPDSRPPRSAYRYNEREAIYGFDPQVENGQQVFIDRILNAGQNFGFDFGFLAFANRGAVQAPIFGDSSFRNDGILASEWIGTIGTAVEIRGELGLQDAVNTAEDTSDVFAFAVTGEQDVTVQLTGTFGGFPYIRIVDQDGRTLAATEQTRDFQRSDGIRFRVPSAGVYYLVIQSDGNAADADFATFVPYAIVISGLAPATTGLIRTGAGFGDNDIPDDLPTVTLLAGNMGSFRIGTGFINGGGGLTSSSGIINTLEDDEDQLLTFRVMTLTVPGSLYNITTGGDIGLSDFRGGVQLFINGDLGNLVTGLSPLGGGPGPLEGDVNGLRLEVGGRIAVIDVRGSIGINQDAEPDQDNTGVFRITSGKNGGNGDIGLIRVGANVFGGTIRVTTSPNSRIGAFLVSQDLPLGDPNAPGARSGIFFGNALNSQLFNLGAGSDIRFVDFPRIDQASSFDATLPIIAGTPLTIEDDGGGRVRIDIIGAPAGAFIGSVRTLPVNGSRGVAIARITANLDGGARLQITGLGNPGSTDIISIGHIIITDATSLSSVGIVGNSQVDVWRITQLGGGGVDAAGIDSITNSTPFGDIVAIDVGGIRSVDITTGDLGRTQVPAWGPRNIGPFLGIQRGVNNTVGGPIGINGAVMTSTWNGATFIPINRGAPGANPTLEDIGSPVDPYLNGLIARAGTITQVLVGGAIGDVIAQGGEIVTITPNFDRITPFGRFDGIIGTIYGTRLSRINVGDGLAERDQSPFSTTGVFAEDDILFIGQEGIPNAFISSSVMAGNSIIQTTPNARNGIDTISLSGGGDIRNAYIAAMNLDDFWNSFFFPEDRPIRGDIFSISGINADIFGTTIIADNITSINLRDGFFDASTIGLTGNLITMEVAGIRNTTLTGSDLEFRPNEIEVGENLTTITTRNRAGDISDVRIDVVGSILGEISARNITRMNLEVDNRITRLLTTDSFRASSINAGRIDELVAGRDIRTSEISVSGTLSRVSAGFNAVGGPNAAPSQDGAIVNTTFNVTGPDGRISEISASDDISGAINSTGPVDIVRSQRGSLNLRITTTTARGNIGQLTAARDVNIATDISGTLDRISAGGNIGDRFNPSTILARGNVTSISAPNGQIYSDIRIGGSLTGAITIGAVSSTPQNNLVSRASILVFGRIPTVNITGDFGGDIISSSGGIGTITITDGSQLPTSSISAFDGDISSIVITSGHLLGSIYADRIIFDIRVVASADGVFGDIGVNPALSSGVGYSSLRNQLPPDVVADARINGASIIAGHNIGNITLTNGSIFESTIWAGRAIGFINVAGDIRGDGFTPGLTNFIAAGDSMALLNVTGAIQDTLIAMGVIDLGADGLFGGVGANADTVKSAWIERINAASVSNLRISAGMTAGADGIYNTGDERVVAGVSYVNFVSVSGQVSDSSLYYNSHITSIAAGIFTTGENFPLLDTEVDPGFGRPGAVQIGGDGLDIQVGADAGRAVFTGPGRAFWDAATNTIVLENTSLDSSLRVVSNSGRFTGLRVISNDDASIGTLDIAAELLGDYRIIIDAFSREIRTGALSGTGAIRLGGDAANVVTGAFTGGSITAAHIANLLVGATLGVQGTPTAARISYLSGDAANVNGNLSGVINIDRSLGGRLNVGGDLNRGAFRSGGSVGSVGIGGRAVQSFISVNDDLGPVAITREADDVQILAGGDLGADALPGGSGFNADRATSGSIGAVTIGGALTASDIVAGSLRGPDGYFGTSDDQVSDGRSPIASVAAAGAIVGSALGSEAFRIQATGSLGPVTTAGAAFNPAPSQNIRLVTGQTEPTPIRVTDLRVTSSAQRFTASLVFNQPMDSSSFASAIAISEVRDNGAVTIGLVQGLDYALDYDAANNTLRVVFSRTITDRNLPQTAGIPGPGVYRFVLDPNLIKAQVRNARLDGNGDGFATENEAFNEDAIVGDAGDKLVAERIGEFDFYQPIDLNLVLDNNRTPDGLPDANRVYTVRGAIGDHPDNNTDTFRFAGDVDLYRITLQAGQILRLGAMDGGARFAELALLNAAGNAVGLPAALELPAPNATEADLTFPQAFLIRQTGTYIIFVGNTTGFGAGTVPNLDPVPGGVGDYSFTLEIFDDGNSGFSGPTDASNGSNIVNAPEPIAFAGPDGVFGTADDRSTITIANFNFILELGADGTPGTADDRVFGGNADGIISTRETDGRLVSTVSSSIGPRNASGLPGVVYPDVDIYHLNGRNPIAPGTVVRATVKLADLGSDLGSRPQISTLADLLSFNSFTSAVQFGVFDTTASQDIDDGLLLFSPTDFSPIGGTPGTLATNGSNTYGFDSAGDFFIQFVIPGRQGVTAPTPGTFAIYLQGVFNADYVLEVVTQPQQAVVETRTQNIFIETRGGTINWLQAGGQTTTLLPFSGSVIGFTGLLDNIAIDQYIVNNAVAQMQAIFQTAGVDVRVSTNPNDFEFQQFSTVFLTNTADPVGFLDGQAFGYSQRSDPLNTDRTDQAVVFVPNFGQLGYVPTRVQIDQLVDSVTAAMTRRVGELLGLRLERPDFAIATDVSVQASNSVVNVPSGANLYRFSPLSRALSDNLTSTETQFFLGRQNAQSLLDRILSST